MCGYLLAVLSLFDLVQPAHLVMWPKMIQKPKLIDFEPLERSESDDVSSRKRSSRLPYHLANMAVVLMQCVLVAGITLMLLKLSVIFYNKGSQRGNALEIGKIAGSAARYVAMFEEFITGYDKVYTDEAERQFRFSVFVKNVMYFEEEEKKHPGLDLDVTRFADWTEEEMRKFLSSDPRDILHHERHRYEGSPPYEKVRRPVAVDWATAGKVTEVKNQGQCGSCWAFATVASVEAGYAIKTGRLTRLSEQEMVDCDSRNNGCNGGIRTYAMSYVMKYGLMKEADYPYRGTDHNVCPLANSTDRVYIRNYRTLSTNEEVIADWIAARGPATFGMNVTKALYSYRSGIFTPSQEDCKAHSLGSHALTIVGYGTEADQPFWLVKNSWGSRWGQSGYFKLARGVNACGVANNVVAPVL